MDLTKQAFIALLFLSSFVNGQNTDSLIDIGHRNYELGKYNVAIEYFERAALQDASNPEIYYLMGVCKSQIQLNKEAIADYDKALVLDSDYAEVHFEKGYSLFMTGKLEEAILSYDETVRLAPTNAVAYVNRGSVKCILGDKEGAMSDWKKAEELGAPIPEQDCDL